jgi:hypothetical protein
MERLVDRTTVDPLLQSEHGIRASLYEALICVLVAAAGQTKDLIS